MEKCLKRLLNGAFEVLYSYVKEIIKRVLICYVFVIS